MPNWTRPNGSGDGERFAQPDEDDQSVKATVSSRAAMSRSCHFSCGPMPSSLHLSVPGPQGVR
jgi:hypothetical protein